MASLVDDYHFQMLAEEDPRSVCGRAPCRYDDIKKCYVISVWGSEYEISPHEHRIDLVGNADSKPDGLFSLFIIYCLITTKKIKTANEWISEKDLPGGSTFFRGPHEVPTRLISERFGNDIEAFRDRCLALHGTPLDMGDAAYRFDILPEIPVAVLYWTGDDEFPPEAKLLFDKGLSGQLPLDVIFSLAVTICSRIAL